MSRVAKARQHPLALEPAAESQSGSGSVLRPITFARATGATMAAKACNESKPSDRITLPTTTANASWVPPPTTAASDRCSRNSPKTAESRLTCRKSSFTKKLCAIRAGPNSRETSVGGAIATVSRNLRSTPRLRHPISALPESCIRSEAGSMAEQSMLADIAASP